MSLLLSRTNFPGSGPRLRRWLGTIAAVLVSHFLSGCQSLTNPVSDGVPVRRLPPELLGQSRLTNRPIPLSLLRQTPPEKYLLDAGDVLGVYVEGVLGDRNQPIPVRLVERSNLPPAMGYPVPVRENGTISLPLIEPLPVRGLSI